MHNYFNKKLAKRPFFNRFSRKLLIRKNSIYSKEWPAFLGKHIKTNKFRDYCSINQKKCQKRDKKDFINIFTNHYLCLKYTPFTKHKECIFYVFLSFVFLIQITLEFLHKCPYSGFFDTQTVKA